VTLLYLPKFPFLIFNSQFFTQSINFFTSRNTDGRKSGLKLQGTFAVTSLSGSIRVGLNQKPGSSSLRQSPRASQRNLEYVSSFCFPKIVISLIFQNQFDDLDECHPPKKGIRDELDRYLSTDPEGTKDPMKWWTAKRSDFPCLSRMAMDYLSIPGT
jgi:hypothetical protein